MTILPQLLDQLRSQSLPEAVAVVAAVLYLGLVIRENILCWVFAAISTIIYIWLFFEARLYMESVLNVFYLLMAGYGWATWRTGRHDGQQKPIVAWPLRTHLLAMAALLSIGAVNGYLLHVYSDAAFPFVDSMTTWFAIWATYLVTQKVLENWWYWLVIDSASVLIYWSRELQLTSLLFVIYLIMVPIGLVGWNRSMRAQPRVKAPLQLG